MYAVWLYRCIYSWMGVCYHSSMITVWDDVVDRHKPSPRGVYGIGYAQKEMGCNITQKVGSWAGLLLLFCNLLGVANIHTYIYIYTHIYTHIFVHDILPWDTSTISMIIMYQWQDIFIPSPHIKHTHSIVPNMWCQPPRFTMASGGV